MFLYIFSLKMSFYVNCFLLSNFCSSLFIPQFKLNSNSRKRSQMNYNSDHHYCLIDIPQFEETASVSVTGWAWSCGKGVLQEVQDPRRCRSRCHHRFSVLWWCADHLRTTPHAGLPWAQHLHHLWREATSAEVNMLTAASLPIISEQNQPLRESPTLLRTCALM